jgi:ribosomal protein S18 acetylase RimI-like enzyme
MIETGIIVRHPPASDAEGVVFEMRNLEKQDLPQIMMLQDIIIEQLSRKDLLARLSYALMERHIGEKGFIIGTFVDGELIAFRNVYFPDVEDQDWNLGYDLGLESPDDLRRVVNFQMICVHPDFRGNSLARRMNINALERIRRLNRYVHLCATVSPYNYWNIKVLLECGFTISKLTLKYGGMLRYIVYQNLIRPIVVPETQNNISARLTDIGRQEELIKQGLIGVQIRELPEFRPRTRTDYINGIEIIFSRPLPL